MALLWDLIYFQYIISKPPYPTEDFSGKTIIVTGANIGLGLEACKHFVRLGATKVILASRSIGKGETAKAEIEKETGRTGVVEVWQLDLSSYASTKAFARRCSELPRIDAAILNASVAVGKFGELSEGHETSITVNVISTTLLALLLLPVLRQSATKFGIEPTLNIVGSGVHSHSKFPERGAPHAFDALDDKNSKTMGERYPTTKLLQAWIFREIATRTSDIRPFVIVNHLSPGFNKTGLARSLDGAAAAMMSVMQAIFAWHPEVGSRTLVHAVTAGPESHGQFMSNSIINNNKWLGNNVTNEEGQKAQKKVWNELVPILESIEQGVTNGL